MEKGKSNAATRTNGSKLKDTAKLAQVRQFGSQKCVNARICAGRGGGVCPYTRPEPGGLEATAGQHGTDRHQQVARRPGGGNDTRSAWQRIARRDVKSTSVVF